MPPGMVALFLAAYCPPGWQDVQPPVTYIFAPERERPQPALRVPLAVKGGLWCVKLAPRERTGIDIVPP